MTADTIRRLITNQKAEHSPHAFRAGGAGMANFNQRYPILRSLPMDELAEWLSLIDAMRATHGGCGACCCKILAYEILFTRASSCPHSRPATPSSTQTSTGMIRPDAIF